MARFSYFMSRAGLAGNMPTPPIPDYFADPGVKPLINAINDIPGFRTEVLVSEGHANEHYPDIDRDTDVIDLSPEGLVRALRDHDPSVEVRDFIFSGDRIQLSATVMDDGEDEVVGRIVRKILLARS